MRSAIALLGLRSIVAATLTLIGVPTLVALGVLGPWSPWALERADRTARSGAVDEALVAYQQIARYSPWDADCADALLRAAVLAEADNRPQRANALLRRFQERWPDHPRAAEAMARRGRVVATALRDPTRGARLLRDAADLDPHHPDVVAWRLEAALHAEAAGAERLAWLDLEQIAREHPDDAPRAWLAMARMRLAGGDPSGAQVLYQRVLDTGTVTEADETLARLGLSICLEDLGDAEGAAAVAEAGALDVRRDRVLHRHEARSR
ncbi:MAG: tetratricopeptide repeat protein [Alphaproteobacteria bacterium]|nr:tetratricopeptide repeat protein [Alphaproteobacteria bacterium]